MKNYKVLNVFWNIFLLLLCLASVFFVEILCFTKYLSFKFDGYSIKLSIIWDCIIVCAAVASATLHCFIFDRRNFAGVYHWIALCIECLTVLLMLSIVIFRVINVEIYDAGGLILAQIWILLPRVAALCKYRKK